jgi:acyl-CoA thioesterase FadM
MALVFVGLDRRPAMSVSIPCFELYLPRHAVGPRQAARAGELWRLCQEAAVQDSIRVGWPPARFAAEGVSFIVSRMTMRHHREVFSGEAVTGRTWVRDFRRGILTKRQVELIGKDGALIAEAVQQWVHVARGPDGTITPTRAADNITCCFAPIQTNVPEVRLPEVSPVEEGPEHRFTFEVWHVSMDPLAHANHPVYLDWCDENTSRVLAGAGLDPQDMVPVADEVNWKIGAVAGDVIQVTSQLAGVLPEGPHEGAIRIKHRMTNADESVLLATATTIRRHLSGVSLRGAFRS